MKGKIGMKMKWYFSAFFASALRLKLYRRGRKENIRKERKDSCIKY